MPSSAGLSSAADHSAASCSSSPRACAATGDRHLLLWGSSVHSAEIAGHRGWLMGLFAQRLIHGLRPRLNGPKSPCWGMWLAILSYSQGEEELVEGLEPSQWLRIQYEWVKNHGGLNAKNPHDQREMILGLCTGDWVGQGPFLLTVATPTTTARTQKIPHRHVWWVWLPVSYKIIVSLGNGRKLTPHC